MLIVGVLMLAVGLAGFAVVIYGVVTIMQASNEREQAYFTAVLDEYPDQETS